MKTAPQIKPTTLPGLLLQRLYLNRAFRRVLVVVLVATLVVAIAAVVVRYGDSQGGLSKWLERPLDWVSSHPRLAISDIVINGASARVSREIAIVISGRYGYGTGFGDVHEVRQALMEIPSIRHASVSVDAAGSLDITVEEKVPVVALEGDGQFQILDKEASVLATDSRRDSYPELPLIAGGGAEEHIEEAIAVAGLSPKLAAMTRGLVRIGNRRWDIVLDHGRTVNLPEDNPILAVSKLLALDKSDDILSLDIAVIDLRNPNRVTVRPFPSPAEDSAEDSAEAEQE